MTPAEPCEHVVWFSPAVWRAHGTAVWRAYGNDVSARSADRSTPLNVVVSGGNSNLPG
jgi:hypothetical protein